MLSIAMRLLSLVWHIPICMGAWAFFLPASASRSAASAVKCGDQGWSDLARENQNQVSETMTPSALASQCLLTPLPASLLVRSSPPELTKSSGPYLSAKGAGGGKHIWFCIFSLCALVFWGEENAFGWFHTETARKSTFLHFRDTYNYHSPLSFL